MPTPARHRGPKPNVRMNTPLIVTNHAVWEREMVCGRDGVAEYTQSVLFYAP